MSNKLDPNNYLKHPAIVVVANNYQDLKIKFGSSSLIVKWHLLNRTKIPISANFPSGEIRRDTVPTPIGQYPPLETQLVVYDKPLVQQLEWSNIQGLEYYLAVKNPGGIIKSQIEIWEYIEPQTYSNQKIMPVHQPIDNSGIIAALNANTSAVTASAVPETITTVKSEFAASTAVQQISASDQLTRQLTITTHQDGVSYRIYATSLPTDYSDLSYDIELEGANAQYEVPDQLANTDFWIVCSVDGNADAISVLRTFATSNNQPVPLA